MRINTLGNVKILTSSFPALLHPILVDVECEQHVRVAPLVLIHVGPACAARSDGCVQEEGSFLRRWGSQLALVLELPSERGGGSERTRLGRAKETIKRLRMRKDVKRILEKTGHPEKRRGS